MAKGKSRGKGVQKDIHPKIICIECNKAKPENQFYKTCSILATKGKATVCKNCIKKKVDYEDMKTIYKILQNMDIPFILGVWNTAEKSEQDTFGTYMRLINSFPQYKNMTWDNSNFTTTEVSHKIGLSDEPKVAPNISNTDTKPKPKAVKKRLITADERVILIDKWGIGYSDEELYSFEKKYNLLKDNYPERTAMHTEALYSYIRFRVKEELATAKGDVAEAQKWGTLADKASEKAKLNPNQLSKADLSGGLNGFGELARAVEQAVDIVPVLPKFISSPNDDVDFTIWCYINYARRLMNMPEIEYEDIYRFYEEKKKELEKGDD